MRGWFVLGCLAGCAFDPRGSGNGDALALPPRDAATDGIPPTDDAAIDGGASCGLTAGPPTSLQQLASSSGGQTRPALLCPDSELPIAWSFSLTVANQPNHGNQPVIDELRLRCGAVRLVDGALEQAPTAELEVAGSDVTTGPNCGNYIATTPTAEVGCPAGSVTVGFRVNRPDDVLFNNVALRCASVGPDGAVSTTITTVPVAGTGTATNDVQTVDCPAGTAVVAIEPRSGCGIDGFAMQCAPLTCAR